LDAGPLARDLDQLAADAAARHLHQVARDGRTGGRRLGQDRARLRGDLLARLAHEGAQRGRLRAAAQLFEQRPPARLELAQEAARRVPVLGPAAALASAQVIVPRHVLLTIGREWREAVIALMWILPRLRT